MAQYSPSVIFAWEIAAAEAKAGNAAEIEPAHLLLGICKLSDFDQDSLQAMTPREESELVRLLQTDIQALQQLFQRGKVNPTDFRRRLRILVTRPESTGSADLVMHRSQESRSLFRRAEEIATQLTGFDALRPQHLLQALLEMPSPPWFSLLNYMGIHDPLTLMFGTSAIQLGTSLENVSAEVKNPAVANSLERQTPFLDKFGRDLTQLARDGKLDPVIGRRDEIRSLARALVQKRKRNAILVGDAGVGKTCIVEGLAQQLISPHVPEQLKHKRIIELSMSGLVAGTKYRGEFEERMQALVSEATTGDDIILFIDEIHTLLGAGGDGASDAANILKPTLARSDLHCIGATTMQEYQHSIEKDTALARRFQVIKVNEPTRAETIAILQGIRPKFEEHHSITITDGAIEAAVEFSLRYLPTLRLPDKAIDLIDEACAWARIASLLVESHQPVINQISSVEIAAVVGQRIGMPVEQLSESEAQRLMSLAEAMRQRLNEVDENVTSAEFSEESATDEDFPNPESGLD